MTNSTAEGTPGLVPSGDWIADPAICTVRLCPPATIPGVSVTRAPSGTAPGKEGQI
jgi:hypothetical protein